MMRLAVALLLSVCTAWCDDVAELAGRIEALAAKEPPLPRADTLRRAAKMLAPTDPELSAHFLALASCISGGEASKQFALPKLTADRTVLLRLVEEVEHAGDDPSAYEKLAAVIRDNQLSSGLDNPSIRARLALAELDELLDPILMKLDGTRLRMSQYRSKPVLLAFWATWCVPCRAELSKLEKLSADSTDLVVLALSWEPVDTVNDFLREHPYNLPMFIDTGHKLGDRFHIDTLPATVKLDPLQQARQ